MEVGEEEERDDKSVFAKEALKECDSHTTHEAKIPLKEHFDANVCPFIANERCHRHHNIVLTSGLVRCLSGHSEFLSVASPSPSSSFLYYTEDDGWDVTERRLREEPQGRKRTEPNRTGPGTYKRTGGSFEGHGMDFQRTRTCEEGAIGTPEGRYPLNSTLISIPLRSSVEHCLTSGDF